jgi:NADPH-dependent 2,4-dienoyl-CoA reductase/sulfur reductase-like enzyme
VLEDVARGLAVYVLDGEVHLLRLRDGADRVVAAGTLARFMDTGLVYADGARIRMTPFARLPLW